MLYIGADDCMEMVNLDYLCFMEEQRKRIKEGVWETKDGENIYIRNMTISHIQNCISFLKRKRQTIITELWVMRFNEELAQRMKGGNRG